MTTTAPDVSRQRLLVLVVSATVFAGVMSTSMLNLAQPELVRAFGVDYETLQWRHVVFWTALGIGMPTLGRLARSVQPRTLILVGLGMFVVATTGSALTTNFGLWLAFQMLQGLADAFIVPAQSVIIRNHLPENRTGWAFGLMSSVIAAANVAGPGLGGLVLQFGPWQLIFATLAVIAVVLMPLTLWLVPVIPLERTRASLPLAGAVLFGGLLVAAQALVMPEQRAGAGVLFWSVVLAVTLLALLAHERIVPDGRRFVPRALTSHRGFLVAMLRGLLVFTAANGVFFFLPSYLRESGGMAASAVGVLLLLSAIFRVIFGGWGGKQSDRRMSVTLLIGSLLFLASIGVLALVRPANAVFLTMLALLLSSAGAILLIPGLNKLGVQTMPPGDTGTYAGFFQLAQFLPGGIAGALFGSLVTGPGDTFSGTGYRMLLGWCAVLLVVATLLALAARGRTTPDPSASPEQDGPASPGPADPGQDRTSTEVLR
ncbi:MFS transporter [Micromonospora sp. NPDC000316]|uniref:MFS transporter n=1 Tax=Micromonospora sp. NPDC000316 TaxID=3364216 RepID=UPI0036C4C638